MGNIEKDSSNIFPHIANNLKTISSMDLPFENTYFTLLKNIFSRLGEGTDNFYDPIKLWEVIKTSKYRERIPEIQIKVIEQGIRALEIQLERQYQTYGNVPDLFQKYSTERFLLVRKHRTAIEKYLIDKMNNGQLFILTRNKKYGGTFSFNDLNVESVFAHYITFPEGLVQRFSELDILFIDKPQNYTRVPSQKKERGKRL